MIYMELTRRRMEYEARLESGIVSKLSTLVNESGKYKELKDLVDGVCDLEPRIHAQVFSKYALKTRPFALQVQHRETLVSLLEHLVDATLSIGAAWHRVDTQVFVQAAKTILDLMFQIDVERLISQQAYCHLMFAELDNIFAACTMVKHLHALHEAREGLVRLSKQFRSVVEKIDPSGVYSPKPV